MEGGRDSGSLSTYPAAKHRRSTIGLPAEGSMLPREFNMAERVDESRSTLYNVVSGSNEIHGHMTELTHRGLTFGQISEKLGVIFDNKAH